MEESSPNIMRKNKFSGIKTLDELLKFSMAIDKDTYSELVKEIQIIEDILNIEMHDVDSAPKNELLEAIKRIVDIFGSKLTVKERQYDKNKAVPSLQGDY
jgi:hypothetical protein